MQLAIGTNVKIKKGPDRFTMAPLKPLHGHLKFRAGSTFPVPVCTISPGHWVNKDTLNRTSRCNKVDAVRLKVEFTFTKGSILFKRIRKWRFTLTVDNIFMTMRQGILREQENSRIGRRH